MASVSVTSGSSSGDGEAKPSPSPLWEKQARQWSHIKPPLRPAAEDLRFVASAIARWHRANRRAPGVLVIGATAEFAPLPWPDGTEITAMDISEPMLQEVWLKAPGPALDRRALCANWLEMPVPDASFDLVLADGSFSLVHGVRAARLASQIRRVLRRSGAFVLRAYCRPLVAESAEKIWSDLVAGRIGTFHAFKLRLLMSLADDAGLVRVAAAIEFFRAHAGSARELARLLGWPEAEIATIEAYQGQDSVYWFPVLAELREVLGQVFMETDLLVPGYELGGSCPSLCLVARD